MPTAAGDNGGLGGPVRGGVEGRDRGGEEWRGVIEVGRSGGT